MKKYYELSETELRAANKEFRKTPYGKRMKGYQVIANIEVIIFAVVMLTSGFLEEDATISGVIKDGFLWVGLLIGAGFEAVTGMMYGRALKEYIETSDTKK